MIILIDVPDYGRYSYLTAHPILMVISQSSATLKDLQPYRRDVLAASTSQLCLQMSRPLTQAQEAATCFHCWENMDFEVPTVS